MKIKLLKNMKLQNGELMMSGVYDDANQRFPKEIYDEIESHRSGTRRTQIMSILEEDSPAKPEPVVSTMDADENVLTTTDEGESTTTKKRYPSRKRKIKTTFEGYSEE